ncbi:MAG: nucleotidyltransferase [Planctomycetes bacterium]|nr:nucleotidyltransferase [Planctomycetota bacterium]MBI3835419.1 nucleotidyltransferase [Planctomycetota bacterium]
MATIQLPTEFKEFLSLLNSNGVNYLVVGGYAVALHGHPRTTGDLDVWIAISPDNITRVKQVLTGFGFSKQAVDSAPLHLEGQVIRMGMPPLRIELLTGISGVVFNQCYERRKIEIIDNIEIPVISREDLIANKRAAGRPQDIADARELQ